MTEHEPALLAALPRARPVLPWLPLGHFPAAIQRVTGLLPPRVELWVMREDRVAPLCGGNKVRKLEFLLGAARAAGRGHLHTFGGAGSHHVLATALHGARAGFAVKATLFPQPVDDHVREMVRLELAAGADLQAVSGLGGVMTARLAALADPEAVWLAGGGSSVCGTLGWVSGGLEIAAQVQAGACPSPDAVYVALGSTGTAAGLAVGLRLSRPAELWAVRAVGSRACGRLATRALAEAVRQRLSPLGLDELPGTPPRLRVDPSQLGKGYGFATAASLEATRRARAVGLPLEPIYTGKVMAALMAHAASGQLDGRRVLFINTASSIAANDLLSAAPRLEDLPAALGALVGRSTPPAPLA
jgi:D-cysteine desulfhydrase